MSRILLVSPKFHGYWRSIAGGLEALGHTVVTHLVDERNLADKTRHKLGREVPARLGRSVPTTDLAATQRAVATLREERPDRVLVVKGDSLGADFTEALGSTPRVLWLYDELRRTHHTEASLAAYPAIASYSRADTAALADRGHRSAEVPLAFDHTAVVRPRHGLAVTFIGARYPQREKLLVHLAAAGVPVVAHGRDWSRHVWDRARTMSWTRPAVQSGPELGRDEAYSVMAGSPATLNIHGDQDGFTMRTFEACGIGAVQLIDRAAVSEFYEPGREVLVFHDQDELVELAQRCQRDASWGDQIRIAGRDRTLAEHTFVHRARQLDELWEVPA